MLQSKMHADHELNRISWDVLANAHGQDAYYDSAGLISGQGSLIIEEETALGTAAGDAINGLSVLHLQCHLGFDAITLARRGAVVTGVDFSPVAIAKASSLAKECEVDIDWICADATALPAYLHGRFDLVWATMGVICWIADIQLWMQNVAFVLKPGGKLVLIDGMPGAHSSWEGPTPGRREIESGYDYATPARVGRQTQFLHTMDGIVASAARAGLALLSLEKHHAISTDLCIAKVELCSDGLHRRRADGSAGPILFSMIAMR